jgi:hypothetical protein
MGKCFFERYLLKFLLSVIFLGLMSFLLGCGADKKATGEINVPIHVQNSNNIGSIDIDFKYNPDVLEITDVLPGELTQNAMMEYNSDNPGILIIGIIDTDGISGSGDLVIIKFDVVDQTRTSQLDLVSVKTHDASSLIDVINKNTDGIYKAEGNVLETPVISFAD